MPIARPSARSASCWRAERPDDGLAGRGGLAREAASGRRWVVDPLDGTINFLYGFPAWAVSVALEDADGRGRGRGALADPRRDVPRGPRGGRRPGRRARCRCATRDRSSRRWWPPGFSLRAGAPRRTGRLIRELLPAVRDIRRAGAAALDLAWLAAGRVDAFFERGLNHWDWAAGRLLVEEAGGTVAWLEDGWPGLVAASGHELLAELRPLVAG